MLHVLYGSEKKECATTKEVLDYLRSIKTESLITVFDYAHNGSMTSTQKVLIRAIELQSIESLLRYTNG